METIVTRIKGGLLVSEGNIQQSDLYLENGKIRDITRKAWAADVEIDAGGLYVSAGFIDIHTHGANGYDYLDGTPEAFFEAAKMQAKGGATSVVATVTSSDTGSMLQAIRLMEQIKYTESGGADILGLHLEGPYFAMSQRGAQDPRHIRVFKKEEYSAILSSTDVVLRWSAAPELPGASEFAGFLTKKGVLPSIGHSDADSTCVRIAFQDGFTHVTHLYSGTSIVHRKKRLSVCRHCRGGVSD